MKTTHVQHEHQSTDKDGIGGAEVKGEADEPPDSGPRLRNTVSVIKRSYSLPNPTATRTGDAPVPVLQANLTPNRPIAAPPSVKRSIINVAKYSWLNVLLVFVPISWALHFAHVSGVAVFITSGLAIIPLAGQLSFATEELALRMGDTLGALLNCTFGNAIELIIAVLALIKGELRVVQSAMVGSVISNTLLVLGCAFVAGGLRTHQLSYSIRSANVNISLLGLSVLSISLPTAYSVALDASSGSGNGNVGEEAGLNADEERSDILSISRGTSFMLLIVYAAYLVFQLWTHAYLYRQSQAAGESLARSRTVDTFEPHPPSDRVFHLPERLTRRFSRSSVASSQSSISSSDEDEEGQPKLCLKVSLGLLLVVTAFTGVTAEWLVDSIDDLTATGGVSREFVGLILLPLLGNACEHATAIIVARKKKLDLAINIAVGSSIQIALLVIPFLVLLAWIIGQPLSLFFDLFETIVILLSCVVVNWAIQDGTTNWLEGFVLIVVYAIIALGAWYYPGHQAQFSV